jgi:hypothetical protein
MLYQKTFERVNNFLCDFMSGEIGKPVVVERAAKPPCFRSRDINRLLDLYKSNKKCV